LLIWTLKEIFIKEKGKQQQLKRKKSSLLISEKTKKKENKLSK
jgi:hypothetical protein